MTEILSTAVALTVLVAAFAGLVAWVRRDVFAGGRHRTPADRTHRTDTVERDHEPLTVRRPSPAAPAEPAVRRARQLQVSGS